MELIYLIQFFGAMLALAIIFVPLTIALRSMQHDKKIQIDDSHVVNAVEVIIPAHSEVTWSSLSTSQTYAEPM